MARHVPHLYVAPPWSEGRLQIDQAARSHLEKVLRVSGAATVTYTDGAGVVGSGLYEGGWIERGDEKRCSQPARSLTVAVSPPKSNQRVRWIVEKLAELGVSRLVWLRTRYTEGRPPRIDKARAWALGALEQSQGAWLMAIEESTTLEGAARYGSILVADRDGGAMRDLGQIDKPVLCVGPEGGIGAEEIPEETPLVKLGETVLRTETAAVAGAVLLIDKS